MNFEINGPMLLSNMDDNVSVHIKMTAYDQ